MIVPTRQHRVRSRALRPRSGRDAKRSTLEQPAPVAPQLRERNAGGPEDRALYRCACGCLFEASVSATVGCPDCGDAQAW